MAERKDPLQTIPGFYAPGRERTITGVSGQYSALDNLYRSFYLDTWVGQSAMAATAHAEAINNKGKFVDDKNYNPLADPENDGYEQYVIDAKSPAESYYLRTLARRNNNLRRELEVGGAGPARFVSQFADPVTYVPIPLAKGIGFVQGAKRSLAPVAGTITASELARHNIDPTSTAEETLVGITFGTMFGTALGGAAGSFGRTTKHMGYTPGQSVTERMGERFRNLMENADGPNVSAKSFEEAAAEIDRAAAVQNLRIVNDAEAPGNTVVDREAGVIRVNEDRIRAEYRSGKLLQGVMARLGERSGMAFSNIDIEKVKRFFDENGGEDRYVQFMVERELNRQKVFAKSEDALAGRLTDIDRAQLERSIFEHSLRKSGSRVTDVLQVGIPKEILERQRIAEERLRTAEEEINRLKTEKANKLAEAAGLRKKAAAAPEKRADGRKNNARTKWLNQADQLEKQAQGLDEASVSANNKRVAAQNDVDSINTKIDDLGQIEDLELMELASTGIGLEKTQWSQLPWYALNNTKFRELSPKLAKEFIKLAWQLAGSPGLRTVGAKYGIANDVSVEMLAKQWNGRLRTHLDNSRKIYMRYLKNIDATRGQGYLEVFKQNMPLVGRKPTDKMSWDQFKESVSRAMFNNDAPSDNPFVDEAVREWRLLFDEFEKAGKETGVFQSIQIAQRNYDKALANFDNALKSKKTKEIDAATLRLDEAEQALEHAKTMGEQEGRRYMHRMWRADRIERNREKLREMLTADFLAKPEAYINGRLVKFDTDPVAVAARVEETIVQIEKEAMFVDTLGLVNKGDKVARGQNRIQKYRDEIAERGDQEFADGLTVRQVREKQIEMIQRDIDKGNGVGLGGPSPILSRKLAIDDSQYSEFMELDIEVIAQHYTMRMGPIVEMARKFGDFRVDGKLSMLQKMIDDEIAANLGKADAIRAEGERMLEAAGVLRDKVLGVYGIPQNPDAISQRTLSFMRTWNTLAFMGGAAQIAMVDAGKIVMAEGFRKTFGGLFRTLTDRLEKGPKSDWYMAGREVEMAGEALDTVFAARIQQIAEIGGGLHNMSRVEKWAYQQTGPFFFLNGLSIWTDTMKRFAGAMAQSRMIEDSLLLAKGKLPADRVEKLATAGINKSWAKRFARQWEEAGSQKGDSLFLANTEAWTDREAVAQFRAILAGEVNNAIITPGAADKFNFMSTAVGKTMMQYRSFGLAATQRVLMGGLQARDRSALLGALSMVALAAVVDSSRRPDYVDLDMDELIFRSIETSGVLGVFSDINMAMEIASGNQFGLRPMLGFDPIIKDTNWASRTGAVAGAAPSQFLQLLYAMTDPDATGSEQARAYRYMMPYNNVFWWDDIFTRQQRALAETLED
jgi:hypothetical protein